MYYSDTGKTLMVYYYICDDCLLLCRKQFVYNRPIYMQNSRVQYTLEDKYYFYQNKLLKWFSGNKCMPVGTEDFKQANKSINNDLERYACLSNKIEDLQ